MQDENIVADIFGKIQSVAVTKYFFFCNLHIFVLLFCFFKILYEIIMGPGGPKTQL